MYTSFGDFIKQKRTSKGINLRKFAELLDIAPGYMSDIEQGKRNSPSTEKMKRIEEILELTEEGQAGDIVIFGNDAHIGIISDYRTKDGLAFVIHNGGANLDREEDALTHDTVTGHYRFDASKIDPSILRVWTK